MSLLLDTHVVLWWLNDDPALSDDIKDRLDHDTDIHLSAVTVWEVTIKHAAGKLDGPEDLPDLVANSGFHALPVTHRHAIEAGRLPGIHRDPFDRMLVAQARCEGLTLVTRDPWCRKYEVASLAV